MSARAACHKCHATSRATSRFTIEGGGRVATLELCDEDARVLKDYQALVSPPQVGALKLTQIAPKKSSIHRARVVTMDELEALKRRGKA